MSELGVPEWDLADRLVKARRVGGVSRPEMADYLGMHRNSLGAYESGQTRPSLAVLRSWALRCGVDLDWLRYGDTVPLPVVTAGAKRKATKRSTKWYLTAGPALLVAA